MRWAALGRAGLDGEDVRIRRKEHKCKIKYRIGVN